MIFKRQVIFLFLILITVNLLSQECFKDTLKLSLNQADSMFILQNISLLAEKCNVDAAKAQIIQARLFVNPTLSVNQLLYNTEYQTNGGRKWLDYTNTGETSIQIEKLFLLAGKRNKQIKLAELLANREEQSYFDLLRTLKYSLRSSFYDIYYLQQITKVYDRGIASLSKLIEVFQGQFDKGYISKKELLRLKSSLFSLENERLSYSGQLIGSLSDFNVLMHTSNLYYLPIIDTSKFENITPESLKLQELIDTASQNRFDLKMAQADVNINQTNYGYQKALAVPNLTLSAGWDRNGGYVHNYNFVGLQIDLPFFNRNQGNIKTAKLLEESSKYKLQSTEDQVKADIIEAYANALENNKLYKKFDKKFVIDLDELNGEMLKNFEKKNISLLEFIDYYDAYKENIVQLNSLLYNRINAFENLNFSVGKDVLINK